MNNKDINEIFIDEYNSAQAVRRYTTGTAGQGISHLLTHVYGKLYLNTIEVELKKIIRPDGIRILEYGCGGGMNLINLLCLLKENGIKVDKAYGTDFSPVLIDAAKNEAATYLSPELAKKAAFFVAKNESLVSDFERHLEEPADKFTNSFHLVLGVNTSRYCHRLGEERRNAEQIFALLMPGGVSIMIDMNDKFPLFRSKVSGKRVTDDPIETYIPRLSEYTRPFKAVGFEIIEEGNFCWIPHSAGRLMCFTMRMLTPVLQALFPRHAMRSLVIARKPQ